MKFNFSFLLFFLIGLNASTFAQIVGGNCYLPGTAIEVGISNCGTYGNAGPQPVGYHGNVAGYGVGFVADPPRNGWTTPGPAAYPNYMGDYFLPGSPEEGFGIQIGANQYGNYSVCGQTGLNGGVTGSMTSYTTTATTRTGVWTGNVGGLSVQQTTTINKDSLYIITCMLLQNTTATTMNGVYYMRNVDPDNEQPWTGDFTTANSITYQQPTSAGSRALVSSFGLVHNAYLGLGSKDNRARVSFGGFSNRNPLDVWNGTGGLTGTLGSSNTADEAISIAFNLGNIAPGQCARFAYVYILSQAQLESALNATAPQFFANATNITNTSTVTIGCNGVNQANLNIVSGSGDCGSTGWTWAWSPATGLSTTTGTSTTATPGSTTVYTASATDVCGSIVYQQQITVVVAPTAVVNAGPDLNYCGTPVLINATVSGGTPFTTSTVCGPATAACSGALTNYTLGTGVVTNGTTGYPNPYGNWYWGARNQFLVRASELTALGMNAGNINQLSFNVNSTNGVTHNGFTIKLACTSSTTLSTFQTTGFTTVFGPTNHTPTVGLNTHNFTTNFFWDGTSNIIVETCFNNSSYTLNSDVFCTTTAYTSCVTYYQDAAGVCGNNTVNTTSANRPNMRFRHCTTPPASTYYQYSWTPAAGLSCTTCEDPTASAAGTYTLTMTDAIGCVFTDQVTIFPCTLPLGIDLKGQLSDMNNSILSWSFENDYSFNGFEIERSTDGNKYTKVGALTVNTQDKEYVFADKNLSPATYYYRLKKLNKDGNHGYSNTVEITVVQNKNGFQLMSIQPNPAATDVTLNYALYKAGKISFALYDMMGKKVKEIYADNLGVGTHTNTFSVSELSEGTYLIVSQYENSVQHYRLAVVK